MKAATASSDARLPVWLDGKARRGAAYLVEGEWGAPAGAATERFADGQPHASGCPCCAGRSGAAVALGLLFMSRARGSGPAFTGVVVRASLAGQAAVVQAIAADAVAQARYRLG